MSDDDRVMKHRVENISQVEKRHDQLQLAHTVSG
jgi:hypothetical protein